jgi:hypothetical protein
VPCEDNFQYTSTLVYDGVDAHGPFDYYLGEIISYTRILEFDNGIVHTNVLINHDLAYTPSPIFYIQIGPTIWQYEYTNKPPPIGGVRFCFTPPHIKFILE